jgi:hypothetical protein
MCNLIRKLAVLLSILTLLSLANASAELKRVPLILMDTGNFEFRPPLPSRVADLTGTGASTHLGQIKSVGVFKSLGPGPPGRFKGEIEGIATAVPIPIPTVSGTASGAAIATANEKEDTITYRLSAEFRPDSGIFYGIGTYVITGGSGKFKHARGFGEFIGLANFNPSGDPPRPTYNCFLRGVISY